MRSTDRRNSDPWHGTLFGAVAAALAITAIIGGSLRLTQALRPRTGDIIAIMPTDDAPLIEQPNIVAQVADRSPVSFCILNPRVMLQTGGSVVIEATRIGDDRGYRVHWAGGPTNHGSMDCGFSAELWLTRSDVAALTLIARDQGRRPGDRPGIDHNSPGIGRRVK